ncbi:MAG: HAMP domain-containing protein [Clostridia bacterium]|nr:HAMP domain-containing protein [Clostridia bacterium]
MFKTLFSRMLTTYLAVTLGLLLLFGVTVGAVFQNQYISEKQQELYRESCDIALIITDKYMDDDKRLTAQTELLIIARRYDAMMIVQFLDENLGKCVFMDEQYADKWNACADMDISEICDGIFYQGVGTRISDDLVRNYADMPVMSLTCPIIKDGSEVVAALIMHTDTSDIAQSIRQMRMDLLLYSIIAVVLAMMAVSYITGKMTKPITDMNQIVRRYSKGEFDLRVEDEDGDDEVSQLGKSFNTMADGLNTLEEARRSFVANVSHELRSPLTSMRGFLEAMQDGTIPVEEQGKYLDIVINENRRMTAMVNDLLDLARIESGQVLLKTEAFDINELMMRTLLTFEARIDAKKLDVELDIGDKKLLVDADPSQIAQVLRNLIDNAIKFTPDGGSLKLITKADKKQAVISVQDSGKGIDKESIPHLFERFYKAEKAHTPGESAGTGLGLAIVKRIIDQHDQEITVESQPGKGTRFTFTLKRVADNHKTTAKLRKA